MAVKSILDIDVNDEKFKRFTQLFEKYQTALAKTPDRWKKINNATAGSSSQFQRMTSALLAQNQLHREIAVAVDKQGKTLQHHAHLWTRIHHSTTGVLKDVATIGGWLVKGGVGLGLTGLGAGVGSLFGLLAMSSRVSNERNFALSTGTAIGQKQAFEKFQGRNLASPDAVLRASMLAQAPGTKEYAAAAALRISTAGTPYDVANRILQRIRQLGKQYSAGQISLMYPGLAALGIGTGDIEAYKNLPVGELGNEKKQGDAWARAFYLNARQGKEFQDFQSKVGAAFHALTTQIERDMVPLLGPIEHFIGVLGRSAGKFLSSPLAARGINTFAHGIEEFANYLGSREFQMDLDNFLNTGGKFIRFMQTAGNVTGFAGYAITHPLATVGGAFGDYADMLGGWARGKLNSQYVAAQQGIPLTHIQPVHVHIDPLPLIKIKVEQIPGMPIRAIQNLRGGI